MAGWTTVTATGNAEIDGLLVGRKWTADVTYNFPTISTYYPSDYFTAAGVPGYVFDINGVDDGAGGNSVGPGTFAPASAAMMAAYSSFLATQFAGTTLLGFSQLDANASVDISIGRALLPNDNQAGTISGHAYQPGGVQRSGDTWYSTNSYYNGNPANGDFFVSGVQPGGPGWFVMLHEAGHSVGLKHAHEDGTTIPSAKDSYEYTVMTYRDYVNAPPDRGYDGERYGRPQTLMSLDIQALQYLYGADFVTNGGGSTYTFSPTTGQMFINGVADQPAPGANRIFRTIWDGGGVDTYNLSNYTTNMTIDLTPGGWSTFDTAQLAILETAANSATGIARRAVGNVSNALQYNNDARSLIENAVGGSGADRIVGNQIANTLTGSAGNDTLIGADGLDILYGDDGDDVMWGGAENTLTDLSNNILVGGTGNDQLNGGAATDSMYGDDGLDTLNGGAGIDYLVGGYDLSADLLNGGADGDNLYGFGGNDTLNGDDGADGLYGGEGDDTLAGGAGLDFVMGEGGNDVMWGDVAGSTSELTNNTLVGVGGNDTMHGAGGIDSMYGDDGADLLNGYGGIDYMVGGYDLSSDTLNGGDGGDNLYGFGGADLLNGGNDGDGLYGGDGGDTLNGDGGDDFMMGENGNDTLDGGSGNDTLIGQAGADVFKFTGAWGADAIQDFQIGTDLIDLSGAGVTSFSQLSFFNASGSTLVFSSTQPGNQIYILGIPPSSLTAASFGL